MLAKLNKLLEADTFSLNDVDLYLDISYCKILPLIKAILFSARFGQSLCPQRWSHLCGSYLRSVSLHCKVWHQEGLFLGKISSALRVLKWIKLRHFFF